MSQEGSRDPAFQARLVKAMEEAGLDQSALAAALGATQPGVWKWVNLGVLPAGRFLKQMPKLLNRSGHYLLTGEGNIYPPNAKEVDSMAQSRREGAAEVRAVLFEIFSKALGEGEDRAIERERLETLMRTQLMEAASGAPDQSILAHRDRAKDRPAQPPVAKKKRKAV